LNIGLAKVSCKTGINDKWLTIIFGSAFFGLGHLVSDVGRDSYMFRGIDNGSGKSYKALDPQSIFGVSVFDLLGLQLFQGSTTCSKVG
jgi:hypothetical protein